MTKPRLNYDTTREPWDPITDLAHSIENIGSGYGVPPVAIIEGGTTRLAVARWPVITGMCSHRNLS